MKRDLDLIRLLLLELEGEEEVDLSEYTEEQQGYHKYLIVDADLAEGADMSSPSDLHPSALLHWLNWAGHDFLDAARSEPIWKSVKQKLAKVGGSAAFEVVKALLIAVAKEQVGL
jgi:hypothetical protein